MPYGCLIMALWWPHGGFVVASGWLMMALWWPCDGLLVAFWLLSGGFGGLADCLAGWLAGYLAGSDPWEE